MTPPHALTLRPACAQEARIMAEMSRELIEGGLHWRYTPIRMAALIAQPDTLAVVARDAQHIQGFAVLHFGDMHAHLALFCVQAHQQRRGIGRRLHEWLLLSAQVAGMASITLELRADNVVARLFYRQLGFAETVLVPGYYDGQVAARRMRLQLRAG
jgi:[ribosomal protein S18]-alanine N-acetyltransferase